MTQETSVLSHDWVIFYPTTRGMTGLEILRPLAGVVPRFLTLSGGITRGGRVTPGYLVGP